jgi:hypothetical protein
MQTGARFVVNEIKSEIYRFGLIDRDVEHALQLIRKIGNDFAHSITTAKLSESAYRNGVLELERQAKREILRTMRRLREY